MIKGLVQGVSYRYNTYNIALSLEIKGVVKNLRDGSVLVIAEGLKEELHQRIDRCKEGPKYARVAHMLIEWSEALGEFDNDFKII